MQSSAHSPYPSWVDVAKVGCLFFIPRFSTLNESIINQSTNQHLVESLWFCHRPNLSNVYFGNHTHLLTQPRKLTNHSDVPRPSNVVLLPSTPFSGSVVAAKVAKGVTVMLVLVTVASRMRVSSENSTSLSSFTDIHQHISTFLSTTKLLLWTIVSFLLTYLTIYWDPRVLGGSLRLTHIYNII